MKIPIIGEPIGGQAYLDLKNIKTTLAMGKSTDRLVVDTAGTKFIDLCVDCGATSGDARGIYDRLYLTGAAGCGESLRAFTTVENVIGDTAHGAHMSLNFAATGKLTGLGVAARATLHIANQATQSGTLAAVQAEIWSDGATSDPAGAALSAIRVVNAGNATGMADVDDDCALFDFAGWTVGDGNMIATDGSPTTCPNITHSIKVRLPSGAAAYLYLGASPVTA